ncbi:hypothetical protein V1477_019530, partial [Vespula maculifrons]
MVVIRLSPVHSKELWSPSIVFSSPRVNELECSPTSYPVVDAMALNVRDHVVPAPGCVASTIEYRFCQIGIARPPGRFRKRVMHTRIRFFVLRELVKHGGDCWHIERSPPRDLRHEELFVRCEEPRLKSVKTLRTRCKLDSLLVAVSVNMASALLATSSAALVAVVDTLDTRYPIGQMRQRGHCQSAIDRKEEA